MKTVKKSVLILFFILHSCSSFRIVKEPLLERTTVKSETLCFSFFSFCREGAPNSILVRGIAENNSGAKNYFLDYYLKSFEVELPIGISLKIDDSYYNLKKISTDYSDNVMISSELSPEIIEKIQSSKAILLSYSNRTDTLNIEFSSGEHNKFLKNVQRVKESLFSVEKLNIVK